MLQQLILDGIVAGAIYALIALGFTIIYRTVNFFHLAHGVVYACGAYIAYSVWRIAYSGEGAIVGGQLSVVDWAGAILAGVVGAAILGVVVDRVVYRPLRRRKAANLVFLIASFGVFIFVQNLVQLIYGAQILTMRTGPVKEGHHILGAVITNIQILILVVSFLLAV
ncbi:MAG: branched-chain amino acid ABC transporter permease, partial [Planctomycetota bacterium]